MKKAKEKDNVVSNVHNHCSETTVSPDLEFDLRDMWDTWDGQFEFVGNAYRDAAAESDLLELPKIRKHHPHSSPALSDGQKVKFRLVRFYPPAYLIKLPMLRRRIG